ncbi:MAG: molybdopterin-dependent oxidoreductase, partial [Burkholderiaceae bacterium]
MKSRTDLSRRRMLAASSSALAAAGLAGTSRVAAQAAPAAPAAASQAKPLPAYVAWKDADSLIVHTPTTIETKRTAFGSSVITPAERLFIRNNLPAPDVAVVANRDAWQMAVEGVRKPGTLTVAELKTLGLETIATVLQCSGNGRSYFPTKPAGTRWQAGAAGCVLWSGVPVRAVAQALGGPNSGMRFITG